MEELGVDFRATRDLDIVLCVEVLDKGFVKEFWKFIQMGGYETKQRSTGRRLFYRFHSPKNSDFPDMLELFSRIPDALQIAEGAHLTPIPVEEEVSSLSAILLDDAYYALIHGSKRVVDGLAITGAECLIPLKARAYLDLSERKQSGVRIDTKDVRKHKNDIFRLYSILNPKAKPIIPTSIKSDLVKAFRLLKREDVDLKSLGIKGISVSRIIEELEAFYELNI